ncbi:MAG: ATP-dependent DNA helicase RecQ [Bacteroidia bacterium]
MAPLDVLKQYWGYDSFREPQAAIIEAVMNGKDVLALLPTGGGKSVCFQVPALAQAGMALVISPLIALMNDQVSRLHQLGIPAACITSSMEVQEIDHHLQAAMDGAYKFLYVSPERLQTEMFRLRLPAMPVSILAVDEAHCISQWGYDFRPPYLDIAKIRELKPDIPIIALTASATEAVQEDIIAKLAMKDTLVFRKSFLRPNIRYFVLQEENVASRILAICQKTLGTGIVYARTRKLTVALAAYLKREGVSAAAYNGGMPTSQRDEVQEAWLEGSIRVIVATNAFGMGIDKPNVRFVVHHNTPFDLESYYQEAGRGGRDGQTALAIAFNNPPDLHEAKRWVSLRYPLWQEVLTVYEALHGLHNIPHTGAVFSKQVFDLQAITQKTELPLMTVYHVIKLLDREGMLKLEEDPDDYGYLRIKASPNEVLRYRKKHPSSGEVLEHALRSLGGEAYHYEQRFVPGRWAELLGKNIEELNKHFQVLIKAGIIYYQAPRSHPRITFFQPRQRLSKQILTWDKYTFLEQQAKARFESMKQYLVEDNTCRSLRIQRYFGEETNQDCGVCDVCIARKKALKSHTDKDKLTAAILHYIRQHPDQEYREVVRQINEGTREQREQALRVLLDEQLVEADAMGKLQISGK